MRMNAARLPCLPDLHMPSASDLFHHDKLKGINNPKPPHPLSSHPEREYLASIDVENT